jgi:AraC-like DNA-binding protein
MDDALSKLLQDVRPRGAVFSRSIAEPSWSLRFVEGPPLTVVVPVTGPPVRLAADGTQPVRLAAPQVALVRGPAAFVVSDRPTTSPKIVVRGLEDALALEAVRRGVPGGATLLTGTYQLVGSVADRVLGALPPVAVVDATPALDVVTRELGHDRPGRRAVLDRALDLLLVTAVRAWFDRPESAAPAWYLAYADPVIGQSLRLVDENPAHPWSVAELAAKVGLSRATFAKRFADLVGQPPMAYITEWRLCLAADLLRRTDSTVDAIAHRVGYANAYALSVAFKRVYGTRPSEHRTAR